jgi:RNA polymerase primary sigma factor
MDMKRRQGSRANEDALRSYFEQIRKTPLLSFEEECEYSRRVQQGDETARHKLIMANLRLVVKIAKTFISSDVGLLDLIQEGNLGLMKAAEKYDYRKNVRFSTYASWWIKQSITRALANKRRAIRLPHRKEEALKKIQRMYNILSQRFMRKPSVEEIASELRMRPSEVASILNIASGLVSLDSELGHESGTLFDLYEDTSYSPEKEFFRGELREETMQFLEKLMDKERQILLYRFSFYGGKKYTLKRIGDELGISAETVRQIELRALKKLREQAEDLRMYASN